jgi:ubiquinone/menaquinone biosynthesis C-methylase UbiE
MLAYARQNFPDIEFIDGVSNDLPFEDNSFDLILSIEVMRYLHQTDIIKTYKEVHRILKKDGYFFVTHVNKLATDFYYLFYQLKGFIKKAKQSSYQNCYFTSSAKELKNLSNAGFSKAWGVGRMFGSIRIGYKFGKSVGTAWAKLLEKFSPKQKFSSGPLRSLAGHLFMMAQK